MCVCTWAVPNLPIPGIGSTEYLHPMMDTLYFSFIYSIFFVLPSFPHPQPPLPSLFPWRLFGLFGSIVYSLAYLATEYSVICGTTT